MIMNWYKCQSTERKFVTEEVKWLVGCFKKKEVGTSVNCKKQMISAMKSTDWD